jgi:hypothetical protein
MFFTVILIIQSVLQLMKAKEDDPMMEPAASINILKNKGVQAAVFVIVLCAGYAALFEVLGYVLASTILMLQCEFLSFAMRACTVGLLLAMESFALLKKLPKKGFLGGIRANRKLLRAFFFWEIATLSIIHISCLGMQAIMVPLILIPIPGILLISAFTQLNDKPPRAGGILCLLAMVPVTVWLCSTGPMALYKLYFLLIMLGGYVMFFLLQLIYHADWFKKTK